MTANTMTKRERRDAQRARKSANHARRHRQQVHNKLKTKASIVFGMVMTMPNAPAVSTVEYVALKMIIHEWPTVDPAQHNCHNKLDAATALARHMIMTKHMFHKQRIDNAIYHARFDIDRALKDYRYYLLRHQPLPTSVLLSSIEHSLTSPTETWRRQLDAVRN